MVVDIQQRRFYCTIERSLFNKVKKKIEENNNIHPKGRKHLKLDVAIFFIVYIQRLCLIRKDELVDGHVRLKGEYLQKYRYNYSQYLRLFKDNMVISTIPYKKHKHCFGYKVLLPDDSESLKYLDLPIDDNDLLIAIEKNQDENQKNANDTCPHLTKWLNSEYISLDTGVVITYIDGLNLPKSVHNSWVQAINNFRLGHIYYSRNGKDNRLHSILTSFPKDLRKFVRFKKEKLVALDIKASQPFFLGCIIHLFRNYEKLENKSLSKILVDKIYHIIQEDFEIEEPLVTIKDLLNDENPNNIKLNPSSKLISQFQTYSKEEFDEYINAVTKGDFYEYIENRLGDGFLNSFKTVDGNYKFEYVVKIPFQSKKGEKKKYNTNKKVQEIESKRNFIKKVIMKYFFGSYKNQSKADKKIENAMPKVVVDLIHRLKKNQKNKLAILLQNIESITVIDIITKKLNKKYPDLFIATIHDSIVVPKGNEKYVKNVMEEVFEEIFGLIPIIERENWF